MKTIYTFLSFIKHSRDDTTYKEKSKLPWPQLNCTVSDCGGMCCHAIGDCRLKRKFEFSCQKLQVLQRVKLSHRDHKGDFSHYSTLEHWLKRVHGKESKIGVKITFLHANYDSTFNWFCFENVSQNICSVTDNKKCGGNT